MLSHGETGPALPEVGQGGMGIKGNRASEKPGRHKSFPLKSIFRTPRIPGVLLSLAAKHPCPQSGQSRGLTPRVFPRATRKVEG